MWNNALFVLTLAPLISLGSLVLLVCCWFADDVRVITKLILTLVYAASWALLLLGDFGRGLVPAVQLVLLLILGWLAFGPDFFSARH